ncbi:uncharacterized protein PV07_12868, partial [Cladophialophora immunda]
MAHGDSVFQSPGLTPVKPEYGPRSSPAPLVPIDELSSNPSEAEEREALRHREKPLARKGRANRTFADGVLILNLDPHQRTLASEARREPLDSRSQSEEEEEEEEDGDDDDDNAAQRGRRQMKRPERVIRHGAHRVLIKLRLVPGKALLADPDGPDDGDDEDEDFPMVDTPA